MNMMPFYYHTAVSSTHEASGINTVNKDSKEATPQSVQVKEIVYSIYKFLTLYLKVHLHTQIA